MRSVADLVVIVTVRVFRVLRVSGTVGYVPTTDRETDPTLTELTRFVLDQGPDLEEQWITEHIPDALRRKCTGCEKIVADGKCYFHRAAHRAREIRTCIRTMRETRECDEEE